MVSMESYPTRELSIQNLMTSGLNSNHFISELGFAVIDTSSFCSKNLTQNERIELENFHRDLTKMYRINRSLTCNMRIHLQRQK